MKKFVAVLCSVFVCAFCLIAQTGMIYADEAKVFTASYNDADICIEYEIDFADGIRHYVNLIAVKADVDPETLTPEEIYSGGFAVFSVRTDMSGHYQGKVTLPENVKSGLYRMYAIDSGVTYYDEFSYINPLEAGKILATLNITSISYDDFAGKIAENTLVFGFDNEVIESVGDDIFPYMYAHREGVNLSQFRAMYTSAHSYALLKDELISIEDFLEGCSELLGIDDKAYFASLSDEAKADTAELFLKEDTEKYSYHDAFMRSSIYAQLINAENYVAFGDVIKENAEFIGLDMSDYDDLKSTQKTEVFKSMWENPPVDFDGIEPDFDDFVEDAEDSGKSSGGGGGGSGSSKKTTITNTPSLNVPPADPVPTLPGKDNQTPAFGDAKNHWASEYISWGVSKGIVNGYEDFTFRPDNTITRAEFAKMISTAMSLSEDSGSAFDDCPADAWFTPWVYAAYDAGLITGYDGRFNPESPITREDCALIVFRALGDENAESSESFSDSADISEYASQAVYALKSMGVITGYENKFNPKSSITRAECITIIYKALGR